MKTFYTKHYYFIIIRMINQLDRQSNLTYPLYFKQVLSKYDFYNNTGFWPNQFQEIMNELKLIPNTIIHRKTRCKATKELSLYILLRRWRKADNWEDVQNHIRQKRSYCIIIYCLI